MVWFGLSAFCLRAFPALSTSRIEIRQGPLAPSGNSLSGSGKPFRQDSAKARESKVCFCASRLVLWMQSRQSTPEGVHRGADLVVDNRGRAKS